MILSQASFDRALFQQEPGTAASVSARSLGATGITLLLAAGGFALHVNLASAMAIFFLVIVVLSIRWGLRPATFASVTAVLCLDYLFAPPLFHFSIRSPDDWVALAMFEATALLVSRLSWRVRAHAQEQERQSRNIKKLYDLSNAILLIDGRTSNLEQLAALLREFFLVESVELWAVPESATTQLAANLHQTNPAYRAYLLGRDEDDPHTGRSARVLRLGTSPIGAMVLAGWMVDASLADAASSLIAVAIERARSLQKENRAEAARNTEQLRTAVLDALAHGFKTPLTAIQTASSGLLAIGKLGDIQAELVTLIDQQALVLGKMTTRLLQTAAFDTREIRVRSTALVLPDLLQDIVAQQEESIRRRICLLPPSGTAAVHADPHLVGLALTQLLDNAAKYAAIDTPITLAVSQDDSRTSITVSNQGEPIAPEHSLRIFERFYRGAFAAHGPTGTGLGLSVVKKIAEAHDGSVAVRCEGGQVHFAFILPGGNTLPHA